MVVRLQTAEDEIKEYQTVGGWGGAPIGEGFLGTINGLLNAEENGVKYLSLTKNAITWIAQ